MRAALPSRWPEGARKRSAPVGDCAGRSISNALVAAGRGIVLVTAHTGAWDAAAHLLPRDAGLEVMVVMHAEPDVRARLLHDQVRRSEGVRVVHVGSPSARQLCRS